MEDKQHIEYLLDLNRQLDTIQKAEWKEQLMLYINHLLVHDFNKLIQILYRVDVSEEKLKGLLQANQQSDAASIITELLIQRQEEKIKTKQAYKPDDTISEEDKW